MNSLNGKVVIITGASSGIGAATARTLADAGAFVVLGARRLRQLDEVAQQILATNGKALAVECDIRDEKLVYTLVNRAAQEFGRIDILVNNAGVMLQSRIANNRSDEWRQMFETNVLGLLYASAAAIPYLRQTKGHIVNISSVAGRKVRERGGVYSATKWGVNAISEALRLELLADDIRVTIIEPGTAATELVSHITDPESFAAQQENLKQMKPLQGEDVAAAVLWSVTQPKNVSVNEILLRPGEQTF